MRASFFILSVLVLVQANLLDFFKKKTDANPADYCQDKDPKYCKEHVNEGFCDSKFFTKEKIKEMCMKSCQLCCGDKNKTECEELKKKDYCTSAFATRAQVRERCGETCGLCGKEEEELPPGAIRVPDGARNRLIP